MRPWNKESKERRLRAILPKRAGSLSSSDDDHHDDKDRRDMATRHQPQGAFGGYSKSTSMLEGSAFARQSWPVKDAEIHRGAIVYRGPWEEPRKAMKVRSFVFTQIIVSTPCIVMKSNCWVCWLALHVILIAVIRT